MPELPFSGRNRGEESTRPSFDAAGESPARGELRLRVLNSLPRTPHQQYLAEEIRKLCTYYLRNKSVSASEVTPEELLSEIWKKMLGSVFLGNEESLSIPDPSQWSVDPHSPERDGRVVWLIREIGGAEALSHRHRDILRQRFGRKYQFVQPSDDEEPFENNPEQSTETGGVLNEIDVRRIWSGLLTVAEKQFPSDHDVSMLLRVMQVTPSIFDDAPGGQWPINEIASLLSRRFPQHTWSAPRVDNAKRRLIDWIRRLMQKNRLDATGLEALFARVARQKENRGTSNFPI